MGASFCGADGRKARGHGPLLRGPHTEKAGGEKVPVREGRPHCFRSEAAQRTVRASFPAYGSRLRMTCYVQSGFTTIIPWLWTLA